LRISDCGLKAKARALRLESSNPQSAIRNPQWEERPMKRMPWVALALLLLPLSGRAPACSLCGSLASRQTLCQEMESAKVVLYGTLANPRFDNSPGAPPGSGLTDLHIARVLRTDPALGNAKTLVIPQYLPVLDAKDPPKFVVLCKVADGKLQPYTGRSIKSEAVLKYVEGALALQGKDRVQTLLYFFAYLDNADETIAADAFLEFARSSDQEIAQIAPRLPPDRLRRLLQDPRTPSERLSLYGFLLGTAGTDRDADLLRDMILRPTDRTAGALDGLLSGYIQRRPREGWDLVVAVVSDGKRPFSQRFAAARTLRFYHTCQPVESRREVLRGLDAMLPDGEVADLAIEDLRRWKLWDLTAKVLAQYGRATHDTPIVRRTIIRYALCCPQPEARQFIANLRRLDPGLVRELEEGLE
jgi:hypothetical protein